MNALLTVPQRVANSRALVQYSQSLTLPGFDIACISCPVLPRAEITHGFSEVFTRFASEAKERGCPACVLIQTSLLVTGDVDMTEAQFHIDNQPARLGDEGYMASCASSIWLGYVKGVISLFVQDFGYDWMLLDPPTHATDIPGTKDRFYKEFLCRHPDLEYPQAQVESAAYLAVQEVKEELLHNFCRELIEHARRVGAERIGIVPASFAPNGRHTNGVLPNPSCDSGRLITVPGLDFVVVRMGPVAQRNGRLCVADIRRSPLASYPEVLAYSVGKPVLATTEPLFETEKAVHSRQPVQEDLDHSITASLAAAPAGIVTQWNGRGARQDAEESRADAATGCLLPRFGRSAAPIAFVFSSSGARHAHPYTYETVWESYWAIARQMLLVEKHPMLTFSASALEEHLEMNPQVRILVLEEHFPLTAAQVQALLNWWTADPKRALVVIGGDRGFSADVNKPGVHPLSEAFPGLLERAGLLQDAAVRRPTHNHQSGVTLKRAAKSNLLMQLDGLKIVKGSAAGVRRVFGSRVHVLYTDELSRPLIARWSEKSAIGYFCGLESCDETAPVITCTIRDAMWSVGLLPLPVACCSEGVLWNWTSNGYIVLANCSDSPGSAAVDVRPQVLWDVLEKRLVKESYMHVDIAPRSVRAFRCVAKRSKFYDVAAAMHVASITDGAGRADITLDLAPDTAFIVNCPPRMVMIDDIAAQTTEEDCGDYIRVSLTDSKSGRHVVTLRW